jgi:hypothetical protein
MEVDSEVEGMVWVAREDTVALVEDTVGEVIVIAWIAAEPSWVVQSVSLPAQSNTRLGEAGVEVAVAAFEIVLVAERTIEAIVSCQLVI